MGKFNRLTAITPAEKGAEPFYFCLVHFTGARVIIGEIIRGFDKPGPGPDYFNDLDAASYRAAKKIFPYIKRFHLFSNMNIERQARAYWKLERN